MESKRTNIGSLFVVISIFTLVASQIYIGIGTLFLGVILISIQYKTKIDFKTKGAIKYYSIFNVSLPFFRNNIDLKEFDNAYLYQISEKGTMQTKVQTISYKNLEYWIKLKGINGNEFRAGYINNYEIAKTHLELFKKELIPNE